MKKRCFTSALIFVILLLPGYAVAQEKYTLGEEQELIIFGTSTMHNWEMVTSTAEGSGVFTVENGMLGQVDELKVSFKAESLESGRGRIMDRNARRALKWEDHPLVTFELERFEAGEGGKYKAEGKMTAAGVSRTVSFDVTYSTLADKLEVRGFSSFKLTDFEIKPPVALAGTLRTSDAVSIEFTLVFEKEHHE